MFHELTAYLCELFVHLLQICLI